MDSLTPFLSSIQFTHNFESLVIYTLIKELAIFVLVRDLLCIGVLSDTEMGLILECDRDAGTDMKRNKELGA